MVKHRETFRKKITTPELIKQINKENQRLMNRFLKNFSTKHSPLSTKNYKSDLEIFFCWNLIENENIEFAKIRKIQFAEFFDYALTELKWSPNRYLRMHSCLCGFSNWIENYLDDEEGYEDFRNLVKKIEKPAKDTVRKKTVLQQSDIDKLFDYFDKNDMVQDACLLALAINCGARIAELARFTLDLIDENNTVFDGLFIETTSEIKTKGRGTNGKLLKKYILKEPFLPHYHKWIKQREIEMDRTDQKHNYIFINANGLPATSDTLRSRINNWSKIIGMPIYPHCLRHFIVSFLKEKGIEDDLIVFIIGWEEGSGSTMVGIYNDLSMTQREFKSLTKLKSLT